MMAMTIGATRRQNTFLQRLVGSAVGRSIVAGGSRRKMATGASWCGANRSMCSSSSGLISGGDRTGLTASDRSAGASAVVRYVPGKLREEGDAAMVAAGSGARIPRLPS